MPEYRIPATFADRFYVWLVFAQAAPLVGRVFRFALKLRGVDIPPVVLRDAKGLVLRHGGSVVIHYKTQIGTNVTLHQGVTVGRSDVWLSPSADFEGFELKNESMLCANAVVVGKGAKIVVGTGTVVGANSVLTRSTGDWEIWAGVPAKRVGNREPSAGWPA